MRPSFYQPSGRIPALTVLAFLCSLAGAGLGAFLYALASAAAPGYVNAFLALAYALWLAFLVHAACHLAKVRNPGFMKQFGLLVGLSAWALHWMCWIVFASFDTFRSMPGPSFLMAVADLFAGPGVLLQELGAAIEATEWFDHRYDFFPRAMCWLFELSILVSLPSQAGASRAGRPFCEASQRWAGVTRLPQRFAVDTVLGARRHLAPHPEQLLTALSPLTSERSDHATVTLYFGKRDSFISVEASKKWFDRHNGGQEQRMIVEYLRVPPRALDRFVKRLSHPDGGTRHARSKKAAKRSMESSAKAS